MVVRERASGAGFHSIKGFSPSAALGATQSILRFILLLGDPPLVHPFTVVLLFTPPRVCFLIYFEICNKIIVVCFDSHAGTCSPF